MKQYRLSQEEVALFCKEATLLYHAGVELGSGMVLLAEDTPDRQLRELLQCMARQLDMGMSLSDALKDSGAFPAYVCQLIHVGELTGHTEDALRTLAQYYQYQVQLKFRLRTAFTYPAVLMLVMLTVIVVLLTKVLPVFDDVYARLGGSMTGIAGGLLRIGRLLDNAMPVLCAVLAAAVLAAAAFCLSDSLRGWILSGVQKRWGHRGLLRKLHVTRFAYALAMGMSSGLMMEEALDLAGQLLKGLPLEASCHRCAQLVREGKSFCGALSECGLLPAAQCRLLDLAQRSGCGEEVMYQITRELETDADNTLELTLGRIEPAMVLVTSVLVGMILLSVMLPLLDIMSAIG